MKPRSKKPSSGRGRLTTMGLANLLKVSRETVQAWIRKGIPRDSERGEDGKLRSLFDPEAVKKWLEDQGSARAGDMPEEVKSDAPPRAATAPETIGTVKIDLALAELRRRRADASKREHDLGVRKGLFLLAAEVQAGRIARVSAIAQGLASLPARVSVRAANRDAREVEAVVREEVDRLREEFARETAAT